METKLFEKDQSLCITLTLMSVDQANYAASNANRFLGMLRKAFISRDSQLLKKFLYIVS